MITVDNVFHLEYKKLQFKVTHGTGMSYVGSELSRHFVSWAFPEGSITSPLLFQQLASKPAALQVPGHRAEGTPSVKASHKAGSCTAGPRRPETQAGHEGKRRPRRPRGSRPVSEQELQAHWGRVGKDCRKEGRTTE